ncbi:glycosyltransferase [Pseudomonas sp.]|uniref:glycosyltransferase n=1 Tax=Pseudomonas sp. TaxID=306 RepID=UPI002C48853F|nr:glycosyltransferase [Pseudomonas sp.]HUE91175.1 glycosyltransferase [Pseudomonas sp.]
MKAARVLQSVASVMTQSCENILVTVVDNSCSDDNFKILLSGLPRSVRLLRSEKNLGYTRAVNYAVDGVSSSYVLLLNPDVIFDKKTDCQLLLSNFSDNDVFIVGPAQINDDGSRPSTVRGYPGFWDLLAKRSVLRKIPYFRKRVDAYLLSQFDYGLKQPVPWLQSSCVLVDYGFWVRIGGLDERFFLFMADIKICQLAYEMGGKVIYDPAVTVVADGQRCSEGGFSTILRNKALQYHVKDAIRYYTNL